MSILRTLTAKRRLKKTLEINKKIRDAEDAEITKNLIEMLEEAMYHGHTWTRINSRRERIEDLHYEAAKEYFANCGISVERSTGIMMDDEYSFRICKKGEYAIHYFDRLSGDKGPYRA